MNRIDKLTAAITNSLDGEMPHKVSDEILSIPGFSGGNYKRFANRLLSHDVIKNYLEIGVWQGSTAISALHGNNERVNYTLIDNFSEFDGPRNQFHENWNRFMVGSPNLIDEDCFSFNPIERGIREIDAYFYDGQHEEINQYRALTQYYESMANSFIFMVDDWGWAQVQNGTYRAIDQLNLKVAFKMEKTGINDSRGWWNGCGIFVLEK